MSIHTRIQERAKKNEKAQKNLAARSGTENLSALFSGIELGEGERQELESLLIGHSLECEKSDQEKSETIRSDLDALITITGEIKSINAQSTLLHGERIKRVQQILGRYRNGAFTAWLLAAHGNRQTPYNLLGYYEFHAQIPAELRPKFEAIPRTAVYTLISRDATVDQKIELIASYDGETRAEMCEKIREEFPIDREDRRSANHAQKARKALETAVRALRSAVFPLPEDDTIALTYLMEEIFVIVRNGVLPTESWSVADRRPFDSQ